MRQINHSITYTILLDVSGAGSAAADFINQVKSQCRLASIVEFDSGESEPSQKFSEAIAHASRNSEALVYLKFPILVTDATVAALFKTLSSDHMFGAASPRFSNDIDDQIFVLPEVYLDGASSRATLTRRALAALPAHWITPEIITGCLVLNPALVANSPPLLSYSTIGGCLAHTMASARRKGFRTIIDNRVVIRSSGSVDNIFPTLNAADRSLFETALTGHFANLSDLNAGKSNLNFADPVQERYAHHPLHRLERFLVEAFPQPGIRRRILIDARSMMVQYNGTTVSQLGYLSGFQQLIQNWDIHVLVREEPAKAHKLRAKFPELKFHEQTDELYACTVYLSQPVFVNTVRDLHRHGFALAGNMLDTITWDMILGAPAETEKVWNFIGNYFDCMFYISEFSKRQFNTRFATHDKMSQFVTYLSFKKSENSSEHAVHSTKGEKYLLVFGNGYDHKDVTPTVQRLRDAFPEIKIKAIGPQIEGLLDVESYSSGGMSDDELQLLIANCSAMIFPSWIEGFGMPVVNGLAYGKNVVVRALPLWNEIATQSRSLEGRLFEFNDNASLKTAVTRAMENSVEFALPRRELTNNVIDWTYCAKVVLDGFEKHLATADSSLWLSRQQIMELITP